MCKKVEYSTPNVRIDKCMRRLIKWLKMCGYVTKASCCGHNKYPMTIIVEIETGGRKHYTELLSNTLIPRKKRYYKRDEEGYYYIPEVI